MFRAETIITEQKRNDIEFMNKWNEAKRSLAGDEEEYVPEKKKEKKKK
mgnify:CR=1 FL=1